MVQQRGNNDIFLGHMKLSRVEIKNYRSIQELSLDLDPKCRILVGINESGKTNILDALNLLDPKVVTTQRDLREPGLHEAQITEARVRFIFRDGWPGRNPLGDCGCPVLGFGGRGFFFAPRH